MCLRWLGHASPSAFSRRFSPGTSFLQVAGPCGAACLHPLPAGTSLRPWTANALPRRPHACGVCSGYVRRWRPCAEILREVHACRVTLAPDDIAIASAGNVAGARPGPEMAQSSSRSPIVRCTTPRRMGGTAWSMRRRPLEQQCGARRSGQVDDLDPVRIPADRHAYGGAELSAGCVDGVQ